MFLFAQTNLQLRAQLLELDYPPADIDLLMRVYDLAVPMFSGQYRASGKPFINHLVGTASVLASRRAPTMLLVAALLHAVYMTADLGFHAGRRQSRRQRELVRELVGKDAEKLVSVYDSMIWRAAQIRALRQGYSALGSDTRDAVLLCLANVYEDFMDSGMCISLTGKSELYADPEVQEDILQLALLADWPELANLLEGVFVEFNVACAQGIADSRTHGHSALRLSPSVTRRLLPTAQGWVVRRLRRLSSLLQGS